MNGAPAIGGSRWARGVETVRTWGRMVKFAHSVFALPFALSGAALAAQRHGITVDRVVWIVVAMVAARNAAMGFNRLVDLPYDARNPRTAGRELPAGKLSRSSVLAFTVALAGLFVFASFRLGPLCGALSPVALAIVLGYSYTKRFTWTSHLFLGLALGIAPVGGWLAVAGTFHVVPFVLAIAVVAWVAGFDVLYACQDEAFDREIGLHSVPARFGVGRAVLIARSLHFTAFVAMLAVGPAAGLGTLYGVGVAAIGALLLYEHRLVRADDLSKLGVAFFNVNAVVSVAYLAVVLLEVVIG